MLQSITHVRTNGDGVASRRSFLQSVAYGTAGLGLLGWRDLVALQAEELRQRGLSCILLWMSGGPSQFETFDPKPGTPTGGPTKAIATAVNGIHIAETWNKVAEQMNEIALIRSMTAKEGEHGRASYLMHTGYTPSPAVKYPSIGSVVAAEIAPSEFDLPHCVRIGGGTEQAIGPSYLGMNFAPFYVENPARMPQNVELPRTVNGDRFGRRLDLIKDLTEDFAEAGGKPLVQERKELLDRAARLVLSKDLKVFDIGQEKDAVRERYGKTPFGQGCLLARRLVERGVTFVEVNSSHPQAPAAWDTHIDNFAVTRLLVDWVDPAYAALLADLKERGLLEKTLVIWMGEFGRTPKINERGTTGGRDHYPQAFNVALAGCGIKGGRVIGATSPDGALVVERPVQVHDLLCTFYHALQINPRKVHKGPGNLPIKIVEDGEAVKELF
jgi:hypothetical protein